MRVIIPSMGRPHHVARTAAAWRDTGAMDAGVPVTYALDSSDPLRATYAAEIGRHFGSLGDSYPSGSSGMVAAINAAGRALVAAPVPDFALAVLNDDHLPRTEGWHDRLVGKLWAMGTGIVYGDDLIQGEKLPTAWAMTTDIVMAINRVVPCLVSHLFADNAVMDLGRAAAVLAYLPDIVIEHMHPMAGKAEKDEGYARVNSRQRWREDQARYQRWLGSARFLTQVDAVKSLRMAHVAAGQ